jgi:predicted small secreted protein
MSRKLIRVLLASGLFGVVMVLVGCNTMEGVGEDVQAGGEALEKGSEDVRN